MEPKTRETCKHFRIHYIKYARGSYRPLSYGHCVKPWLKKRAADEKACAYWQEKE